MEDRSDELDEERKDLNQRIQGLNKLARGIDSCVEGAWELPQDSASDT
jgi:hypothetical protein